MKVLDRFLLARFLSAFLMFFLFFTLLFVLVELFELKENYTLEPESLDSLATYLLLRIPFLGYASSPVAVILATIFVVASRANLSEVVAAQAAGISIRRYAAPLVAATGALALALLVGAEYRLPDWADRADHIRRVVIQKKPPPTAEFLDLTIIDGRRYVLAGHFVPSERLLESVVIVTPGPRHERIERVEVYSRLRHDTEGGWRGATPLAGETAVVSLPPPKLLEMMASATSVRLLSDKPIEAVALSTLRREVADLENLAGDASGWFRLKSEILTRLVNIQAKLAFPCNVPLLAILGAGIGARIGRRRGLGSAIGAALVCTLGYMLLLHSSIRLGALAAFLPGLGEYAPVIPWLTPVTISALALRVHTLKQ